MSALAADYLEPDPEFLLFRQYLRVSFDESGRERSNDEQLHDNAVPISRNPKWAYADLPPYADVGSASRYARKTRGDFEAILADIRSGKFGANGLQLWESSRGSRKVGEWCTFLDLCEEKQIRILVTTHNRLYDPANHRDWKSLMEDAVDGEYESRKTSSRVGRSMAASAKAGSVPGGRRAFGYNADGTLNKDEAAIVRECVERVLAGESARAIAKDLNARGVRTSAGNAWHPGPLAKMLAGTRIVGIRTHKGQVVRTDRPDGKGAWTPIIDEVTHQRVKAVLATRSPVGRRGRTPWMLTGLLYCEVCQAALVGNTDSRNGVRRYICRKAPGYHGCGGIGIKAIEVEELLGVMVTERLAKIEARRTGRPTVDDDGDHDELHQIEAWIEELDADRYEGNSEGVKIGKPEYDRRLARLERMRHDVEVRLAAKVVKNEAIDFLVASGLIGKAWEDCETEERRQKITAVINRVTVGRAATRGSTKFEDARITGPDRIDWKDL